MAGRESESRMRNGQMGMDSPIILRHDKFRTKLRPNTREHYELLDHLYVNLTNLKLQQLWDKLELLFMHTGSRGMGK